MGSLPIVQNLLHQVHLGLGPEGHIPTASHKADSSTYALEDRRFQDALLSHCPADVWPPGSCEAGSARPIVVSRQHEQRVADLNEALVLAITDIVERWWTDLSAGFPERMPLERYEEELLQWIEKQVQLGNLPRFSACMGSWRPDYLVEDHHSRVDGVTVLENFRITEINARFAFNGFLHQLHGQNALRDLCLEDCGKNCAAHGEEFFNGLLQHFNPDLPLHLLKGKEYGMDIWMFIREAQRRLGIHPRLVTPADLRLIPDPDRDGECILCCLSKSEDDSSSMEPSQLLVTSEGERVDRIYRIGLELHQVELAALNSEMLRQISLRCFNDMRTILLVHDKRMLGIVKQELGSLVAREVVTPVQARILDRGIADTFLPRSPELHEVFKLSKNSPQTRFEYLLKPVRGGKGVGIQFGDELTAVEWLRILEGLDLGSHDLTLDEAFVVQRQIVPRLYDVVIDPSVTRRRYPLVGTFPAVNGKVVGWGGWRCSGNRICAVSNGGAWMATLVKQEDARSVSTAMEKEVCKTLNRIYRK